MTVPNLSKRSRSTLGNYGQEGPTKNQNHRQSLQSPSKNTKMSQRSSLVFSLGTFLLFSLLMAITNLYMERRVLAVRVETMDGGVREGLRKQVKVMVNNNNEDQKENGQFCPSVIRKKVGLFDDASSSPVKDSFRNTVLLVSSNYAYYNMLQNWEFLASELDLKWAVLALDQKLYEELGPERAVPSQESFSVSGAYGWREGNFQTLSCNKMRMALQIANNCKVNVVFTDVDNIFFRNPFEHDLGRLIRSNRYDYLYQPNEVSSKSREHRCMKGKPPKENNTGFYFIRHGNDVYKRVVKSTLDRCQNPKNEIDDQTLFWEEFWKVKKHLESKGDGQNPSELTTYHHCGLEYDATKEGTNSTFHWCCIDPFYYPVGKDGKEDLKKSKDKKKRRKPAYLLGPFNKNPVTYHANHARNYAEKVKKLIRARSDKHGWDKSRFKDGVGGILTH